MVGYESLRAELAEQYVKLGRLTSCDPNVGKVVTFPYAVAAAASPARATVEVFTGAVFDTADQGVPGPVRPIFCCKKRFWKKRVLQTRARFGLVHPGMDTAN